MPENVPVPADVPEDVTVLCQPLDCIYLAASSAMDFYRELGILDQVRLTSTKVADWSLSQVKDALENGTMLYAGRYSTPDYELILGEGTKLAIESTMIYHSPETKETLESLGIPVLVERSSYEPDPLGRMEWIRLYGLLAGCKDQADSFFEKQISRLKHIQQTQTGKRVVFFHISGSGYAVVRKPGDYVSRMIAMAGGEYFLGTDKDPQDNALSTMNMEMESFYEAARDADILIYNSTIDGDIRTIDELLGKSPLLADFRAVKEGNVWCTGRNMFQQATGIGEMILDLSRIIQGSTDNGEELTYLHPVI